MHVIHMRDINFFRRDINIYTEREREKRKQNQGNRQGEKQKEKSYTWQIFKVCQFRLKFCEEKKKTSSV